MSERGAVTPILLAVAAVVVVLSLLVADVGGYLAARQQAAAAADAAALAAAPVTFRPFGAKGTPRQEAARFAALNGSVLAWCRCQVDRSWETREVEVLVRRHVDLIVLGRREIRARSRAEFVPTRLAVASRPPPVLIPRARAPEPR